ncbi:DUF551 domain-containing protein [Pantoea sp. UYEF8]|uniref:DUF551 domain-containing protein n=1 Tax=Pantoea sp. UYEF8 TaxID=1756394 RepID=UPI0033994953
MSQWIKCSERMPIVIEDVRVYKSVEVIVTDGNLVTTCDCCAGMPNSDPEQFWVSFSHYGNMPASQITHWQPLPSPPEEA